MAMIGVMVPNAFAIDDHPEIGKSIVAEIDCDDIGKEINSDIDCRIELARWFDLSDANYYDEISNILYTESLSDYMDMDIGGVIKSQPTTYGYFGVDMHTYKVSTKNSCDVVYTGTYTVEKTIPCKLDLNYFNDQTRGQVAHTLDETFNVHQEYYGNDFIIVTAIDPNNTVYTAIHNYNGDAVVDFRHHKGIQTLRNTELASNADQTYVYFVSKNELGYDRIKLRVMAEKEFNSQTSEVYTFNGLHGGYEDGSYDVFLRNLFYNHELNKLYYFVIQKETHYSESQPLLYVIHGKGETSSSVANTEEINSQVYSYEPTHVSNFPDPSKSPQHYLDRYNNENTYRDWFDSQFPDRTIHNVLGLPEPVKQKIPEWVKNIFTWYSQDQISEDEVLNAIKFLVNQGIINLDN